jgi:cyclopropane-fatty-acyl-phospholipid synthase
MADPIRERPVKADAPRSQATTGREASTKPRGWARKAVLATLRRISGAALVVQEGNHETILGDAEAPLRGHIRIHDQLAWRFMATGGSIGAGEAFELGYWDSIDLSCLLRVFAANRDLMNAVEGPLTRLAAPILKLAHAFNRNTKNGSRKNIAAHYDLGNEFFASFLDRSMMYSAAIFEHESDTLEDAQFRKLDRICQALDLQADDHLLEIGTGWGALAIHAARHYGCRVTTTTISREQHAFAQQRVVEAGLDDRITLLLEDYRNLDGRYDKLVSIEMIEAIGHHYLGTYFGKCSDLLADDGLMLLQAITIEDYRYQQALRSVDYIKRYIFPGCFIPSLAAMAGAIAKSTNMRVIHLDDIGESYAKTLACWHQRLLDSAERIQAMGYPEEFLRRWRFYLSYCEAGFAERALGDAQILLAKPDNRRHQWLGSVNQASAAAIKTKPKK